VSPESGQGGGPVREESVRTGGLPGFVTYDETPIDLVWNIVKVREYCIRDPICMEVDAHEQDKATAKKRFTLKIILLRRRTQTNERNNNGSAKSGCTYCRGELSAWPIRLVPSHAYDPARSILSYFWMSNKVQLNLKKYICRHRWIRRD
jgi:hypothetical protein